MAQNCQIKLTASRDKCCLYKNTQTVNVSHKQKYANV